MRRTLLVVALGLVACTQAEGRSPKDAGLAAKRVTDVSAADYVGPALPKGRVIVKDAYGAWHRFEVEIAATRDARTRGLMWRTEMPEGKGMLFIFSQVQPLSFWMRNTLIPLDMLFIDADLNVVGIVENAQPKSLESRGVGHPSQFVLELAGGTAAKLGLRAGLPVKLEGAGDLKAEP